VTSIEMAARVAIARARDIAAHDAAYLALAQREGPALATLDRPLAAAAEAAGVARYLGSDQCSG
jgi:predicted nucleic acid-binding protein